MRAKQILLSFDVEEFDTPTLDYGKELSLEEQFKVSTEGLMNVLILLDKYNAKATFFTTANYAIHHPELMNEIAEKHEIASHGYYHSTFDYKDLKKSKDKLEEIINKPIVGYRMARMMPLDKNEISKAGYTYDSSVHPTYIPGRYNNLKEPRTFFKIKDLLEIPASVSPILRFPLFWLTFHNFPFWFVRHLSSKTLKKDNYLNIYFHPWEFVNLRDKEKFGLPFYITNRSGKKLLNNLEKFIVWGQKRAEFTTFQEFIKYE